MPDHISLWGLRLSICQPLQQYANVRPTRVLRGTQSPLRNCPPGKLDWVIVRENSEGEYAGQGGRSHRGFPWEVATETAIFSRHGVERIMRFAFETAAKRPRKLLTVVTKSNAQRNGMVLWDEVATEVGKEFPEVQVDKMLVDAMTTRMVLKPETVDTIVASNLVRLTFPFFFFFLFFSLFFVPFIQFFRVPCPTRGYSRGGWWALIKVFFFFSLDAWL